MTRRGFPVRFRLVIATFFLSIILYIDRSSISAAKEGITRDLNLSDKQFGWILSAFALGYALFQVPAGALADRFGPRRVLSGIVVAWASFTALTGAAWNLVSLGACRFFFGLGEAGAYPGIARVSYSWIPMKERGIVNGINFSGSRLGAAVALPLITLIMRGIGWRRTFFIQATFGIMWALIWYLWFRDDPTQHRSIGPEEKSYILQFRQQRASSRDTRLSPRILLTSKNMWLAMFQYFASNFTFFFCLGWAFTDIKSRFQLEALQAGLWTAMPFLGGALGNWISGALVDRLYRIGKWRLSRRLPAIIGFLLAAFGVLMFLRMASVLPAVLFLTLAILGADMTLSPSWSFCVDVGHEHAGATSGMMNMAGNIGSFVTGLAYAYLKDWTGSVHSYFLVAVGLNVLAALAWTMMRPEKTLEEY